MAHGAVFTLSGTVKPFLAGQMVEREGFYKNAWHVWAQARVSRRGTFSFTVHNKTPGAHRMRVVTVPIANRGAGYSPALTVTFS